MTLTQKSSSKFLLFEDSFAKTSEDTPSSLHSLENYYFSTVWSDRFVLFVDKHIKNNNNTGEHWNFAAFDLLTKESIPVRFQKINNQSNFVTTISLDGEFGFIIEKLGTTQKISIVKFDWDLNEFQQIGYFEKQCRFSWIYVEKTDPSKFVVRMDQFNRTYIYQACKFVDGKIEFGESVQSNTDFYNYHDDKLFRVSGNLIKIYDLKLKKEEMLIMNVMPGNAHPYGGCIFVKDRFYIGATFGNRQKYRLACGNLKTKAWKLLDFETKFFVGDFNFCNGNLIMQEYWEVEKAGQEKNVAKFFSIPMRKPNPLRKSAWLLVVSVMKQKGEKDPHKAAKEFLPLNSDLREIWFKDE